MKQKEKLNQAFSTQAEFKVHKGTSYSRVH